jgi:hypothetical protein
MTTTCPHLWTLIRRLDHCEIDEADDIAHTTIVLLGCPRCRSVEPFPAQNAVMLTERYREHLREDLMRQGWTWIWPMENP